MQTLFMFSIYCNYNQIRAVPLWVDTLTRTPWISLEELLCSVWRPAMHQKQKRIAVALHLLASSTLSWLGSASLGPTSTGLPQTHREMVDRQLLDSTRPARSSSYPVIGGPESLLLHPCYLPNLGKSKQSLLATGRTKAKEMILLAVQRC